MNNLKIFIFGLICVLVFCANAFAQETLTITTYYPSPYGSYNELTAYRMKIGTTYSGSGITVADNNLIVEGRIAIGTTNPRSKLTVAGGDIELRQTDDLNTAIKLIAGATSGTYQGFSGGTQYIGIPSSSGSPTFFNAGNVGIGTTTPGTYKLYVNGQIFMNAAAGGKTVYDIAEDIFAPDASFGDVVVIDPDNDQKVIKSSSAYDSKVAGIISENPGFVIGNGGEEGKEKGEGFKPLALAGRVYCKVTTEDSPIKRGDLLVTSSKPGYAMKADSSKLRPGMVLGKALESLEKGEDKILVLVTLQ